MPSLSRRTLGEIRSILTRFDSSAMEEINTLEVVRAIQQLDRALRLKKSVRSSRKVRAKKKETRKEAVLELRAAVFLRSEAKCEVCGADATDLEHAFGRVRVKPSVRNCIALCRPCHSARTNLRPSALFWWERYATLFYQRGDYESELMASRLADKHRAHSSTTREGP